MKFFNILAVAALLFSSLVAEVKSLNINGVKRPYVVFVPASAKEGQKLPLIVMLHAAGGAADRAEDQYGWPEKAEAEGFIVVFPEAAAFNPEIAPDMKSNPHVWDDGSGTRKPIDDTSYLRAVIEEVKKQYPVDPNRVFITGFSNGASMAFKAGVELSDIVTAIAPVAGRLYAHAPQLKRPISVLLIVGSEDPINPLNGIMGQHRLKGPMLDSIRKWLPLIGLDESQKSSKDLDGASMTIYGPNADGVQAVFIVVPQIRHDWPGNPMSRLSEPNQKTFSATDTIWHFFNSLKK